MSTPPPVGRPRVVRPNRHQVEWRSVELDALLPEDHPARSLWAYAESVDLGPIEAGIRSVDGGAGRPVSDRRVLFALWLYATFDGVGSARRLAKLAEEHNAYVWIRGGVPVDYHLLSDFRTEHAEWLDGLLTESMATLMAQGLMTLQRVSQDGVRVRAVRGPRRSGEANAWRPACGRPRSRSPRSAASSRATRERPPGGRPRPASGRPGSAPSACGGPSRNSRRWAPSGGPSG
jgi:transposase